MQALLVAVMLAVLAAGAPAADAAQLTINITGSATGNVAVAGIPPPSLCEHTNTSSTTTCTFQITAGADIIVSSSVPSGSSPGVITGGTGEFASGCAGSTCRKSLLGDSSVTFFIDPSNAVATLNINMIAGQPAGIVRTDNNMCPPTCSVNYGVGSIVHLEETSGGSCGNGCVGAGYTGIVGCGSGALCSFTINGHTNVTALFTGVSPDHHGPGSALALRLSCDPTARRGRVVNVAVEVHNETGQPLTVTRAALGLHVGNVSFVGPLVVNPLDALTHAPALPLTLASDAGGSFTVPVTVPSAARPGTFITVGLSLFGRENGTSARRLLNVERCAVEVLP